MNIMLLFDVIIIILGAYMVGAALKMKKTGVISTVVITQEETARCRDKAGFIAFMYWKEAAFGGIVALVGALGVINDLLLSLGVFNVAEMLIFLAAFLWFQNELHRAREKYI